MRKQHILNTYFIDDEFHFEGRRTPCLGAAYRPGIPGLSCCPLQDLSTELCKAKIDWDQLLCGELMEEWDI